MSIDKLDKCFALGSIGSFSIEKEQVASVAGKGYRLLCTMSGNCKITVCTGETYSLMGNTLLLLCTPCEYTIQTISKNAVVLTMDFSLIQATDGQYTIKQMLSEYPTFTWFMKANPIALSFIDTGSVVLSQMQSVAAVIQYPIEDRATIMSSLLSSLLLTILIRCQEENNGPNANRYIRIACRFIQEHYMDSLSTQVIADHIGISVSHLHRIFINSFGMHINHYITQIRLKNAAKQLIYTDLPIEAIATCSGFATQQYFSSVFKKKMGITPLKYRKTYDLTCDYQNYEKHIAREVKA